MKSILKNIVCALALLVVVVGCSNEHQLEQQANPSGAPMQLKFSFADNVSGDDVLSRAVQPEAATPEECYIKDMVVFICNEDKYKYPLFDAFYTINPKEIDQNTYLAKGGKDLAAGSYWVVTVVNPVGGAEAYYNKYKNSKNYDALYKAISAADIDLHPASAEHPLPMFGISQPVLRTATNSTSGTTVIPVQLKRRYSKVRIHLDTAGLRSNINLQLQDEWTRVCAKDVWSDYYPFLSSTFLGGLRSLERKTGAWRSLSSENAASFTVYLPENTDVTNQNPTDTRIAVGSLLLQLPAVVNGEKIANNYYSIPLPVLLHNRVYDITFKITDLGDSSVDGVTYLKAYKSYYEPFFLNQGYCFFDLETNSKDPVFLEFRDDQGRFNVQRASQASNTATYTTLESGTKGEMRVMLNAGGSSASTAKTRYRIDMVQKPNDPSSVDASRQMNLRAAIPSCHASYKLIVGGEVVAEQEIDYINQDVYTEVSFGSFKLMKYNVGAYTPPSLYYPDSRGYYSVYESSVKVPSEGTKLPNPVFVAEKTGRWICPDGYHVPKQSEWNAMMPNNTIADWDVRHTFVAPIKYTHSGLTAGQDGHWSRLQNTGDLCQLDFPAAGYRSMGSATVSCVGSNPLFWLNCDLTNWGSGVYYSLWFDTLGMKENGHTANNSCCPVRCVKN